MRNELKQDMSALKNDIEKNVNIMLSTALEATTTMMKSEMAEMKNMFSMLMMQMAVSPDHQSKISVSH
eukprot:8247748-Ditylum_brightwellii.AAC.1